jgi:hypothetical protein
MEDFGDMFWSVFSIPVMAIIGSFAYVIVQTVMRARVRELEVRERIAMIERGLVPPPEKDPNGFERAMHGFDRSRAASRDRDEDWDWRPRRGAPARYRSAGVTLLGVGFGLMLMLAFTAGEPGTAIGVGGFIVVMGLAFLINSMLTPRYEERYPPSGPRPTPPPPPGSSEPPRSF